MGRRTNALSLLARAAALALGVVSLAAAQETGFRSTGPPASVLTSGAEALFLAASDAAMTTMMNGMMSKTGGNIDREFVEMMVPHHQGAIDMAQLELRYGHNEQLLRIAQEIIIEQLQEIAAMRVAVGDKATAGEATPAAHAPVPPIQTVPSLPLRSATSMASSVEAAFLAENNSAMNKMMNDMAVKPTGNVDRDFAGMMIPHHQGAIGMAQAEIRYGHDAQLKIIAQEITVDQMQEIALMRLAVGEAPPRP
jgi:uncharacterized protein (DUF305 family)